MIHMEQRNSSGIEFVLGSEEELRKIRNHPPLEPFAEEMMAFLGTLSGWLLKGRDPSAGQKIWTDWHGNFITTPIGMTRTPAPPRR